MYQNKIKNKFNGLKVILNKKKILFCFKIRQVELKPV